MALTSDRSARAGDPATSAPSRIDGGLLRDAFVRANRVIADHRDQLNALNVFPVPDGDTGTNMALTMRSAIEAIDTLAESPLAAHRVASTFAFGALMGARGNSGVILSQILRGFAGAVEGKDTIDGEDIARALDGATAMAYRAVLQPVEGTMLTVIADAAKAATAALDRSADPIAVFAAAADGAEASLRRTPDALDVLRKANVVDSGGQGVAYILRAIHHHLAGDTSVIQIGETDPTPDLSGLDFDDPDHLDQSGYCTNFVITDVQGDLDELRARLDGVGSSAVVVGDAAVLRVHIHTDRPDAAIAVALDHGAIDNVAIQNMDTQIRRRLGAPSGANDSASRVHDGEVLGTHAIVAVANGPGQVTLLLAFGASTVVEMLGEAKPSTEEILRAVEASPVDDVIVLPNSGDTLASAKLVSGLTDKRVIIVPSTSFVAGLQALAAAPQSGEIAANAATMTAALADTRAIELSRAVKDTEIDGITVTAGDWVVIHDGRVTQAGPDLAPVAAAGLADIDGDDLELATIFLGRDADDASTTLLTDVLKSAFPAIAVEQVSGGQAFYPYIVGFE